MHHKFKYCANVFLRFRDSVVIVMWLLIAFGLLLVPMIILSLCFYISGCPLYEYGKRRSKLKTNTHNNHFSETISNIYTVYY